jgi:hypothetical protein
LNQTLVQELFNNLNATTINIKRMFAHKMSNPLQLLGIAFWIKAVERNQLSFFFFGAV